MGTNDHVPTGSARLQPWKSRAPRALLVWGDVDIKLIGELVQFASQKGAYIGFGNVTDGTALLLYIKNGRLNEKVVIESIEDVQPAIDFICDEYLGSAV